MKNYSIYLSAASLLFLLSCGNSSETKDVATADVSGTEASIEKHFTQTDLVDLDLSEHGLPIIVKAPKDSKVLKKDDEVYVYGGKFFKATYSYSLMEGTNEENMAILKEMIKDKEMNPNTTMEVDEPNGYISKQKDGYLSFTYGIDVNGKSLMVTSGMPYDISPDQNTEFSYNSDDIKMMYEAAKATKIK